MMKRVIVIVLSILAVANLSACKKVGRAFEDVSVSESNEVSEMQPSMSDNTSKNSSTMKNDNTDGITNEPLIRYLGVSYSDIISEFGEPKGGLAVDSSSLLYEKEHISISFNTDTALEPKYNAAYTVTDVETKRGNSNSKMMITDKLSLGDTVEAVSAALGIAGALPSFDGIGAYVFVYDEPLDSSSGAIVRQYYLFDSADQDSELTVFNASIRVGQEPLFHGTTSDTASGDINLGAS